MPIDLGERSTNVHTEWNSFHAAPSLILFKIRKDNEGHSALKLLILYYQIVILLLNQLIPQLPLHCFPRKYKLNDWLSPTQRLIECSSIGGTRCQNGRHRNINAAFNEMVTCEPLLDILSQDGIRDWKVERPNKIYHSS